MSITNSLYRRRHSAAMAIEAKMNEARPWKIRLMTRATASGRVSKALIRSRSTPTSVFEAPVANSSPSRTSSTPMIRLSTSDGVRTCASAGGSSISGRVSGSAGGGRHGQ